MTVATEEPITQNNNKHKAYDPLVQGMLQRARAVILVEQFGSKSEHELSLEGFYRTFGDNPISKGLLEEAKAIRCIELRAELANAASAVASTMQNPEGTEEVGKKRLAEEFRQHFLHRFQPIQAEASAALDSAISRLNEIVVENVIQIGLPTAGAEQKDPALSAGAAKSA